jgi:hypothetical protein
MLLSPIIWVITLLAKSPHWRSLIQFGQAGQPPSNSKTFSHPLCREPPRVPNDLQIRHQLWNKEVTKVGKDKSRELTCSAVSRSKWVRWYRHSPNLPQQSSHTGRTVTSTPVKKMHTYKHQYKRRLQTNEAWKWKGWNIPPTNASDPWRK